MYKVPLTNSPNQTFDCTIPVNNKNISLRFNLWYNYEAEYWLLSLYSVSERKEIFANLPLLVSYGKFCDMFCQLGYLQIGIAGILPVSENSKSSPDNTNLGTAYIMFWGDNNG